MWDAVAEAEDAASLIPSEHREGGEREGERVTAREGTGRGETKGKRAESEQREEKEERESRECL